MRIALHGKEFIDESIPYIQQIIDQLTVNGIEIIYSQSFAGILNRSTVKADTSNTYSKLTESTKPDYIISIGGDGTLLSTVTQVRQLPIPILGINTGRLGFLATISKLEISTALEAFLNDDFTTEERTLLRLETDEHLFGELNFALNEVAVIKKDTSSMIKVNSYIDDQFLNTYWADGLMISTPTGSTGYSLSCGGPVILPQSKNFLITPINPHNLNVRPMIVSDSSSIRIEVDSRGTNFLTSLDSRSETVDSGVVMTVRQADFTVKLVKVKDFSFLETLRNKLNWGFDVRN